jgi:hypothetical protein
MVGQVRKFLAFAGVVAVIGVAGCTPTTPPGTTASSSTTLAVPSGLREVYLPADLFAGWGGLGGIPSTDPTLAIDSAKYPPGTVITVGGEANVRRAESPTLPPLYEICVALVSADTGAPVATETCATSALSDAGGISVSAQIRFEMSAQLLPGVNRYRLQARTGVTSPCQGTSPDFCQGAAIAKWVRLSW